MAPFSPFFCITDVDLALAYLRLWLPGCRSSLTPMPILHFLLSNPPTGLLQYLLQYLKMEVGSDLMLICILLLLSSMQSYRSSLTEKLNATVHLHTCLTCLPPTHRTVAAPKVINFKKYVALKMKLGSDLITSCFPVLKETGRHRLQKMPASTCLSCLPFNPPTDWAVTTYLQ